MLAPHDFSSNSTQWTRRIDGGRAFTTLDVLRGTKNEFLTIDGAIVVEQSSRIPYYSVENAAQPKWSCLLCPRTPEQKDICAKGVDFCHKSPSYVRHWGESVGMVMLRGASSVWTCSGVLIAPDLFLTNWHCGGLKDEPHELFWGKDLLEHLLVDFSWDGDELSNEYGFAPISATQLLLTNRDLDYALFRITPLLQSFGKPPYARIRRHGNLAPGTALTLIHHPLGRLKHFTATGCKVHAADYPSWLDNRPAIDFTHRCDSEGGSSGAPVFDSQGFIVGIHHAGFEIKQNEQCDKLNKAVKIDRILEDLPDTVRNEILQWQPETTN